MHIHACAYICGVLSRNKKNSFLILLETLKKFFFTYKDVTKNLPILRFDLNDFKF